MWCYRELCQQPGLACWENEVLNTKCGTINTIQLHQWRQQTLQKTQKINRELWEGCTHGSCVTTVQAGHAKTQAAVGTNMYLELEQSTQVQSAITSGKRYRSFQFGSKVAGEEHRLGSVVPSITYTYILSCILYILYFTHISYIAFGFGNSLVFPHWKLMQFPFDFYFKLSLYIKTWRWG